MIVAGLLTNPIVTVMRMTFATLLTAVLLTGCGTICNQISPMNSGRRYGGVSQDIETARAGGGAAYMLLLDVPISAVTDTLLLPFDQP